MAYVASCEAHNTESLSQRCNRSIDEPKLESFEPLIDLHGSEQEWECWRRIGESTTPDISHERVHCGALSPQKIVHFRQNQTRNVARLRFVDRLAKGPMVRSTRDKVIQHGLYRRSARVRSSAIGEKLGFIPALGQLSHDRGHPRPRMSTVLLEHHVQLPPDEL